MKKRNVIKLTLVREKTDTYLKLWIAPEVENLFRESATAEFGLGNETEISKKWFNEQNEGLKFYRNTTDMSNALQKLSPAYNDFGKMLLDSNGYVNIALLRVVGASGQSGVILRTNDLISFEELKMYVERLANWGKEFYRDYIKKSKMTAVIAYEM